MSDDSENHDDVMSRYATQVAVLTYCVEQLIADRMLADDRPEDALLAFFARVRAQLIDNVPRETPDDVRALIDESLKNLGVGVLQVMRSGNTDEDQNER